MIARLLLALLFLLPQAEKTRVACVGDSITYGACVQDRDKNCYPVVLGGRLYVRDDKEVICLRLGAPAVGDPESR